MIIKKTKIKDWLAALKDIAIFAPAAIDDITAFSLIRDPEEVVLGTRSRVSPKEILLPQTESMFTFTTGSKVEIEMPPDHDEKMIIFGITPCDARAFKILDRVFDDGSCKDPYYLERRKNTILVGLACSSPAPNCFCTSVNGGPASKDDVDILLTDLGDKYFIEVVTDKGRLLTEVNGSQTEAKGLLAKTAGPLFEPSGDLDLAEKEKRHLKAEAAVEIEMDISDLPDILEESFESNYWEKVSMKCLGCRACTYLCPTCHCFDMQDETRGERGRRVRIWDSCMNPEYTLHASGHNPRPARMNRVRNRILHKYKYFPENFDMPGCVGCGRCIDICPVNMDIVAIIKSIRGPGNE